MPSNLNQKTYLEALRHMTLARLVDEKAIVLYKQNKCNFQIGCAGHEAIQVAAASSMKVGVDVAYPYYRDMAFCAAWGFSPKEFFLGIMNKADDPTSGGRQMPMHYGHKDLGIVSQSSPTGTQFLQAVGAARALVYKNIPGVVYVSAGEGTTAQGAWHEALNWAARKTLPIVFVIQDNKYAISVHISQQIAGESVADISSGYRGLEVSRVDGLDYLDSLRVMDTAISRAREGQGPSVVVADVVRLQSHSISDNHLKYRTEEEVEIERSKDPILRLEALGLDSSWVSQDQLDSIKDELRREVDEAAEWAEAQEDPAPETATKFVFSLPSKAMEVSEASIEGGEELYLVDALNQALDEELERDPDMVIYGQDVAYGKGGVFSVTSGLTDKFGENRVFNAPLAEASICGTAVGLATMGLKPVVEVQFGDYIWTGMMQLRNELALLHYRSNGAFSCPAVVRVAVGGYIRGALYHSQNIEATFSHFPGLFVAYPSNATDAKGMLKAAIRDENPVLFLEHKGLYRQPFSKGPVGGPEDLIPLGKAKVIQEGTDATIVTWGALVRKSFVAAQALKEEGFSIEIIDLRTIVPLDSEAILESIKKTGRLLIAHEDVEFMGFGAEIAALAASSSAFRHLDAPVVRVGGTFSPVAHAEGLEKEILPQVDDITSSLRQLLEF